jgi:hypothetical protein
MPSHSHHPPIREHGLADGCERCTEIASQPFVGLDRENIAALVDHTVAWMADRSFPRSETEATAMRYVERAICDARSLREAGWKD